MNVQAYGLEVIGPPPPSSAATVIAALHVLEGTTLNPVSNRIILKRETCTWSSARLASDLLCAIHIWSVAAEQHPGCLCAVRPALRSAFLTGGMDNADYTLPYSFSPGIASHRLVEAMKTGFALRTHLGDPGSCTNASSCFLNLTSLLSDALSPEFASSLRSASPPVQADWSPPDASILPQSCSATHCMPGQCAATRNRGGLFGGYC